MNIDPADLWAQYQRAAKLWPWFSEVERAYGLPPFLLYAEGSRETGLHPDYANGKVHADGTGWGLFGADQNWNDLDLPAFAHDPRAQARLAAATLVRNYAGSWVDAVNAYGPAWARGYAPENYGPDVLARAEYLAARTRSAPMELVTRAEWGGWEPSLTPAPGMTRGVAVHYLGDGRGPTDHADCPAKMREILAFHTGPERGWAYFAYNMAVCVHGVVFEGRGPRFRNAANGGGIRLGLDANAAWASILYLAGTDGPDLSDAGAAGINAAAVYLGVAGGEWLGHRDFLSTACPGDALYAWVQAGHPGPEPTPTPPPPVPDLEVPDLFIFDYVPDGATDAVAVLYTDGRLKWGLPSEEHLAFYNTGRVPHLGPRGSKFFHELDWHPGGIDSVPGVGPVANDGPLSLVEVEPGHYSLAGGLAGILAAAETGDPGCGG